MALEGDHKCFVSYYVLKDSFCQYAAAKEWEQDASTDDLSWAGARTPYLLRDKAESAGLPPDLQHVSHKSVIGNPMLSSNEAVMS